MKKSPWHDISVDPVYVGVYELEQCIWHMDLPYSYWDGIRFNGAWSSIEKALEKKKFASAYRGSDKYLGCASLATAWRGILKD